MREPSRGYAVRVDIRADANLVWRALTDSQRLKVWCSPAAEIRPRVGGLFRASVDRITELEAHIDVFEPARRLRLIYLPNETLPPAETAVVDDFILDSNARATILRLLGSGIPREPGWETYYIRMRTAWERAVTRLKVLVEKEAKQGDLS